MDHYNNVEESIGSLINVCLQTTFIIFVISDKLANVGKNNIIDWKCESLTVYFYFV